MDLFKDLRILTMKASVEVSEREWAFRMMREEIDEVGTREERRSTMRIRGVMKKMLLEV